ncbi:YkgJ family cysteine cluster protein [Methanocaldococcus sp.]
MRWEITFENRFYSCINCTYCCSCKSWRIYLNYFDYLRLKDYKNFIEECEGEFKYRLKVDERGCLLLKNNLCRIHLEKGYGYKPLMCKIFPFSMMVKWDGTPLLVIKHYCRGIKRGKAKKEDIKEAINNIKELYYNNFELILDRGMEHSSKTFLDNKTKISWEEREELGRYILKAKDFLEFKERYEEIFREKIEFSINNNEILEYLRELNKREHFRKLPLKEEFKNLIKIAKFLSKFNNIIEGERIIDEKLFLG